VRAAEQQHVDDLAGGLRGPDLALDRPPQPIKALRPAALLALLAQRQRVRKRAGLALEQLQIVVKLGRALLAAAKPRVVRDLLALMGAVKEMYLEPIARRFVEAGLAVLVFDYRSFGASGASRASGSFPGTRSRTTAAP
jgi:hypothetical protein